MELENKALLLKKSRYLLTKIMIWKIYIKFYIIKPLFKPQHDFINSLNSNKKKNNSEGHLRVKIYFALKAAVFQSLQTWKLCTTFEQLIQI